MDVIIGLLITSNIYFLVNFKQIGVNFMYECCGFSVYIDLPNILRWKMGQTTALLSKPMLSGLMFWSMEM